VDYTDRLHMVPQEVLRAHRDQNWDGDVQNGGSLVTLRRAAGYRLRRSRPRPDRRHPSDPSVLLPIRVPAIPANTTGSSDLTSKEFSSSRLGY